jgi:hypothetical protein
MGYKRHISLKTIFANVGKAYEEESHNCMSHFEQNQTESSEM